MIAVDGDVERVLEAHDDDGSGVGEDYGVGFGVAGYENAAATLGGGHARIRLNQLVAHLALIFGEGKR